MVRWMPVAFMAWLLFPGPTVAGDGLSGPAFQEEVSAILQQQTITLGDLFRVARLRNPTLGAARSEVLAGAGRVRQAGLYPNPTVELEVEELSTADFGNRTDKVSLVQPLIISGRRGNAVAVARANREASVHALGHARREVYRRIHTLWAEQLYFREAQGLLGELLGVARNTLNIAETRFEARAAPESQVTKALLEVYELETAQQRLTRQRIRATAELSALLGGTQVPLDRVVGELGRGTLVPDAFDTDTICHPALNAATNRIEAAAAALREAEADRIPDLGLFLSYGRSRPTGGDFIEAGVSVPLRIFNRNQGRIAESRALVAGAEDQMRIVEGHLQVAFANAVASYHATLDELTASDDRMQPAAERGLAQAQEGYRVGRLPFLELIDAQRTFSNVRLRNLELRRDLVVVEAELLSLAGAGPYADRGEEQ